MREIEKAFAQVLVEYEFALALAGGRTEHSRSIDNDGHKKCSRYFTSTTVRRNFGIAVLRATFRGEPAVQSELAHLVGVSRNSIDRIIVDALLGGWIIIERDSTNQRLSTATDVMIDSYYTYSQNGRQVGNRLNMAQLTLAIDAIFTD